MSIDWNAINSRLPHEKGEEGRKKRKVKFSTLNLKGQRLENTLDISTSEDKRGIHYVPTATNFPN
jgi:hypothetical protein